MTSVKLVVCAAPPARRIGRLVEIGHERGWDVEVLATPSGVDFLDADKVEAATLSPVVVGGHHAADPRSIRADGIIVAPATFNTICKLAAGIADSYALAVVAEAIGEGIPTVVVPYVGAGMAARTPFLRAVRALHAEEVSVLMPDPTGPPLVRPVPAVPRSAAALADAADGFPFHGAADELLRIMTGRRSEVRRVRSDVG
ncbi:flavoprotein [Fodinicola acaciae]|uniref:flavoprotein n=1 Tax=Fodinicola acaciae TaxID=2681555 RepID=UPI0013D4376C|nr:flavoprotein [Fodinicola acaciae]